jgi:peptide/nickel transport system substrate-binding protein
MKASAASGWAGKCHTYKDRCRGLAVNAETFKGEKMKRLWWSLIPVLTLLLVAVACGQEVVETHVGGEKDVIREVPGETGVVEGEKEVVVIKEVVRTVEVEKAVVVAPEDLQTLTIRMERDPQFMQFAFGTNHHDTPGMVMATSLVTQAKDGSYIPRLAESWTISNDSKTFTFKLADRVWSDGVPVTSADVKFSIQEVLHVYNPWGGGNFGTVTEIETPDAKTVVVHLSAPGDLLAVVIPMYGTIVPKHVYEGTDILDNPTNDDPVVAGPYKLGSYVVGSHTTLVRNPTWTGERLFFDRIIFRIIPQTDPAALALRTGAIDYHPQFPAVPPRDLPSFEVNPNFQVIPVASPFGDQDTLQFNGNKAPFNNKKVRQAVAHAINRQAIVDAVYLGTSVVARGHSSHLGLGDPYSGPYLERYDYNPEKAKLLLDEAGYPAGADGERFQVKLTITTEFPASDIAEAIKGFLKDVGITVSIDAADFTTAWSRVFEWTEDDPWNGFDFTMMTGMWTAPPNLKNYYHSSRFKPGTLWSNAWGYVNPEFDTVLEKGLASVGQERIDALKQAQEMLAADLPTLPLTSIQLYQVRSNDIKGNAMGWGLFLEVPLAPFDIRRD